MLQFLLRRILVLIPMLFGVSLVTFIMIHLVPGDPVVTLMGTAVNGAAGLQQERHELGLDQPLPMQYLRYVDHALHGDLGTSIRSGRPVLSEVGDRLPATLSLTLAAMAIAIVLGVGIGTVAASTRSRALSGAVMLVSILGISLPTFWLGLLLIDLFAVNLRWFTVLGDTSFRGLILPAITLGLPAAAVLARVTRAGMVEVLRQDYIRTARAKGLRRRRVVLGHALRNGLIVVLTIAGLQFGGLLAGSIIVESVFSRPGLGSLVINAILNSDYPVIQGVVLIFAVIYVVINTALDILYGIVNPRIRVA
ncbi:MAG TPA: ABC transporter permease [Chloroflexota bacterium]|jgi:ABC-type dipeptide/oligopeptide/nickel transport system permease component|nr:ABC transporter permease [Chloroflexota bacterium]